MAARCVYLSCACLGGGKPHIGVDEVGVLGSEPRRLRLSKRLALGDSEPDIAFTQREFTAKNGQPVRPYSIS